MWMVFRVSLWAESYVLSLERSRLYSGLLPPRSEVWKWIKALGQRISFWVAAEFSW